MPQVVITPWRDNSELIRVRAQFYPTAESSEPDMRRKAVNLVAAWKLRGNLPHTVESTALLTDAVLNDDPGRTSTYSIRAVYSTAFCRFVTGMVDLSQTGVFKRSMYQAANHIGLPESFVELRHQATHDELPVLLVLRQAVTRSLKWLWQYYWRTIDIRSGALDSEDEAFVDGIMNLKDRFRSILRGYMEARMDVVKGKTSKPARDELTKTCQELVLICKGNDATLKMLATVLLECEFLIPADRLLGGSMEDAFLLWDDLLKTLTLHQRSFLCLLTNEMSILIAQPSRLDITIDSYREAVYTWLINILTAEAWAASRKRHNFDPSCVISTCLMNPNHWSRRLAMALAVETDDHLIRAQWGDLVKRSNAQYECSQQDVSKNERVSDIKKDVDRVSMEIVKFEEQAKSASQGGGWVKWQGPWVPKPIGLI